MLSKPRYIFKKILGRVRTTLSDRPPQWSSGEKPRVLFVSTIQGAPMYYRVLHQKEQLTIQHIATSTCQLNNRHLKIMASSCDILYLYRVESIPALQEAITAARHHAARIVFDTDDLVWDQRIVEYCQLEYSHTAQEISELCQGFERTASLMRGVDAFVASTPFLAGLIRADFPQPVFVNMNALSQASITQSETLWAQRRQCPDTQQLLIGYFSGWPRTHEQDLAVALPGIQQALRALPQARLRIVGHFDRTQLPADMQRRVEVVPFVAYDQLLSAIAEVDINIAPIITNPHRRSKSAVKFLEAALVGVPTIASDLEPYHLIQQARTGYLASTPDAWASHMLTLAHDPALRVTIGHAARAQVLAEHSTQARADGFAAILKQVIQA